MDDHEHDDITILAPPGYRFYPTEEELVAFYLHKKLLLGATSTDNLNRRFDQIIPVLDIYQFNPWELPQRSGEMCQEDPEQWFFFVPRQETEARGGKPKRLTTRGYWKASGSPDLVYSRNGAIGGKRTMVFYRGRAPNGKKTEWKMNEYKALVNSSGSAAPTLFDPAMMRQEFSLCRVYKKSKCSRSFDRRPSAPQIVPTRDDDHLQQLRPTDHDNEQQPHQHHQINVDHDHHVAPTPSNDHIFNPASSVDKFNTCSSSGEHQIHALNDLFDHQPTVESNILEMDTFWDWDWEIGSMDFITTNYK